MRRAAIIALLALLALPAPAPAAAAGTRHHHRGKAAAALDDRVAATLAAHLDGPRIEAWLASLEPGSLELEAARWILAWLPLSDLADLELPLLREHVEEAAAAYREAPWRDRLPRDLWLHYVVPHRVSQEPAQPWRRLFRRELSRRILPALAVASAFGGRGEAAGGAADPFLMEKAALAVNRWCREQATYQGTNGRDQGPLTTIARGIGRCEEEVILTVSALRALGLPARSCATPYWAHTDSNHAWAEVWVDGRWRHLGGCEPDRCLDRAWFSSTARRAGFVRATAYGEFAPADEPLYRAELGATVLNTTAVYTDPVALTARAGAGAAPGADIHVNVFNFGTLRPLAKMASGETLLVGPGDYALTAAAEDNGLLLEVVRGRAGGKAAVTLDAQDRYDLAGSPGRWLLYPEEQVPPARDLELTGPGEDALMQRGIRAREAERAKLRGLNEQEEAALAALDSTSRARIAAALDKPLRSASVIFLLLETYAEGAGRAALLDFLDQADEKDLLELDEMDVRDHLDGALAVRGRMEAAGLAVPDSLFRDGVLPCRIAYEPGGPWRSALPLIALGDNAESSLDAVLSAFRGRVRKEEVGFFGSPLNPAQAWRLGRGAERDVEVALVGLLRRNGFPARWRFGVVEAWTGDWIRLDPQTGRRWNSAEGASSLAKPAGAAGERPGRLEIAITRGGLPYREAESYREFNVSRLKDGALETPWWDPLLGAQDWDAGDYVLCAGLRMPGGSAHFRLRAFTVPAGTSARVELPLDLALGDWDASAMLMSGPAPADVDSALRASAPRDSSGASPPAEGLTLLFSPGEPAARMISSLSRLRARLESIGLPFNLIQVGAADDVLWRERLRASSPWGRLYLDASSALLPLIEGETTPVPLLLLRDAAGRTLLCRLGYEGSADAIVHMALEFSGLKSRD